MRLTQVKRANFAEFLISAQPTAVESDWISDFTRINVMQSAQDRLANNLAFDLNRAGVGGVLVQRHMGSAGIVILDKLNH